MTDELIELLALSKDAVMIGSECVIRVDDAVRLVRAYQKVSEQPDEYLGFDALTLREKAVYHKAYDRGLKDVALERVSSGD